MRRPPPTMRSRPKTKSSSPASAPSLDRGAQREARHRSPRSMRSLPKTSPNSPTRTSPNRCSAFPASRSSATPAKAARSRCAVFGSQFTRVRVNGLETVATSTDGASANRDRAFDFNVFASELFSSIVVHKTAEAEPRRRLARRGGRSQHRQPAGGQGRLHRRRVGVRRATTTCPKMSARASPGCSAGRNDAGTFGVSVSAAYRRRRRRSSSATTPCAGRRRGSIRSTARRALPPARPSGTAPQFGRRLHQRPQRRVRSGRARLPPAHPALWRSRRTTASVWASPDRSSSRRPTRPRFSIDGLYSSFKQRPPRTLGRSAAALQRTFDRCRQLRCIDANNNMISATLNDAWVRTEHYLRKSTTEFYQIGGSWDQDCQRQFPLHPAGRPFEVERRSFRSKPRIVFDDRDAQGYSYDYTDMKRPKLTFGTSVTDPANFQLAEIRDRPSEVENKFKHRAAAHRMGRDRRLHDQGGRGLSPVQLRYASPSPATPSVCGNGGRRPRAGHAHLFAVVGLFGPTAVYGFPATPCARRAVQRWARPGSLRATTNAWLVPNLEARHGLHQAVQPHRRRSMRATTAACRKRSRAAICSSMPRASSAACDYALNAGIRYVKTDQIVERPEQRRRSRPSSAAMKTGCRRSTSRCSRTKTSIVRAAVAEVMTRPTLGNLTPGGSVDGFNYRDQQRQPVPRTVPRDQL